MAPRRPGRQSPSAITHNRLGLCSHERGPPGRRFSLHPRDGDDAGSEVNGVSTHGPGGHVRSGPRGRLQHLWASLRGHLVPTSRDQAVFPLGFYKGCPSWLRSSLHVRCGLGVGGTKWPREGAQGGFPEQALWAASQHGPHSVLGSCRLFLSPCELRCFHPDCEPHSRVAPAVSRERSNQPQSPTAASWLQTQ